MIVSILSVQAIPPDMTQVLDEDLGGADWWLTTCGTTAFAGSYQFIMEWEDCKAWCSDISLGTSGKSFQFSDIRDMDEMECMRTKMIGEFNRALGYAGHYWLGGLRDEYGQYKWLSGEPMTYTDFVGQPGNEPYIHLTPGNGYSWNTKSDQNDRNNGCLCLLEMS